MAYTPSDRIRHDSGGVTSPLSSTVWTREKFIATLRVMLADFKEINPLLNSQENSDPKLGVMLDLVLADFNGDTPQTTFIFENFPNPNCLIQGAISMTLDSSCIMHARNSLSYSDDGVSFEDFGKDVRYNPLSMKHAQNYLRLADNIKRNWNARQCFGGFGSEYSWINWRGG